MLNCVNLQVTYYILRGEPPPAALHPGVSKADIDDVSNFKMWIHPEADDAQDLGPMPNVHEQVSQQDFTLTVHFYL